MYYSNNYKYLAETIRKSLTPIAELYTKSTKASFDELTYKLKELCNIMVPMYSAEHFKELALQISDLQKNMLLILNNPEIPDNALDFLEDIDIQNEYVELTEENCDSINALLDLTNVEGTPKVNPNEKTPAIQFWLSIIIPIIIGFLQLWQNENHYKLDSIETQNVQIQEQERYEQIMQSLSDIIDSLNEIRESQESCPCNHSDAPAPQDEEPSDMLDDQSHSDSAE